MKSIKTTVQISGRISVSRFLSRGFLYKYSTVQYSTVQYSTVIVPYLRIATTVYDWILTVQVKTVPFI